MVSEGDYLAAKRTVDDRALNRRVFESFVAGLHERANGGSDDTVVDVIEAGAGTGTMIARLAEWDVLPPRVSYRAIDRSEAHVARARSDLPSRLLAAGYEVDVRDGGDSVVATDGTAKLDVRLEVADAFEVDASADACIAMALLDLVDPFEAVASLADALGPGGLLYAPITFDGTTAFTPSHPRDRWIERRYHRHMAERPDGGGPRAGRRLLEAVPETGGEIRAVGGSSQIVRSRSDGYPASEDEVLAALLETVVDSVAAVVEGPEDEAVLREWRTARERQLTAGRLGFLAHNLDVLGQFRGR